MRPEVDLNGQFYRYEAVKPRHLFLSESELTSSQKESASKLERIRDIFLGEITKSGDLFCDDKLNPTGIRYTNEGNQINLIFNNFAEGIGTEFYGDYIGVKKTSGNPEELLYELDDSRNDKPLLVAESDLDEILSSEIERRKNSPRRLNLI